MSTGEPSAPLHTHDPRQVGAYRLLGRLGEGGQGVVFLGEDPRGFRVAVKVLKIDIRYDAKAKARFVREIAAARQVAPFCTARILAFDIEGQLPFVASEFITGPTLQQRVVARGPVVGSDLDRLAIGTASALAAIHGANVVHCDFKPANVILGPDWPRVIDFGVAQAIDGTGTQTIMGSPAYMAPERFHHDGVAPAADIFSWAATIAFAAAGRPPFPGDTPMSVMRRVADQPPLLSGLSPGLTDLLLECLDKDPAGRPVATDVLLRLVAKSRLTLEPAARRSIGELTTRVIPRQLRRDIDERLRGTPQPEERSAVTDPTWRLSAGRGNTRKILSAPEPPRQSPGPEPEPPRQSPGPEPPGPAPTREVPSGAMPTLSMPPPSARQLSLGPEPTREMSAKLRRAQAAADQRSTGSAEDELRDGDGGQPPASARPGRGYAWLPGVLISLVLGLTGGFAAYRTGIAVLPTVAIGGGILLLAFLIRLVVARR